MPYGYNGKILRVNLSTNTIQVEEPEEDFYRRYFGGRGFISYYLLKELKAGIDPLSADNKLIFATGVVTGTPVGGCGRNSVGAKSPLTNGYGDSEVGGYWGAELKHAGYDAIIIEGKAKTPVYLWIKDGTVEIREATHLWGKVTGECQEIIRQELKDPEIKTALIGPAGENRVRYACILNDVNHAAGRTGLGAVMGSKNLKAIAVRGHRPPPLVDQKTVDNLARWIEENIHLVWGFYDQGTAVVLTRLNQEGGLPTRNFREGSFEGAEAISGRAMKDSILIGRGSCYACPIQCKRVVSLSEPYQVDPVYGGPEYETLAALGSNCGIDDLAAIAKANELCNAYGMDTISTGVTIAFAFECFEQGILREEDTDGLKLNFGNAPVMVELVSKIARREGIGDLLAEGVARASSRIGKGAEEIALHVKGQEIPMHEPRYKQGLGLGYALSPTGADHCHNLHDNLYMAPGPPLEDFKGLGILSPLPVNDLSPAKVRMLIYHITWYYFLHCLIFCQFVPLCWSHHRIEKLVRAVTGWNSTVWELMKVGERCLVMTRAFNIREGLDRNTDLLPKRFFTPFSSGPLAGVSIDKNKFEEAKETFYSMMGWDRIKGIPSLGKLQELDIGWVAEYLGGKNGD